MRILDFSYYFKVFCHYGAFAAVHCIALPSDTVLLLFESLLPFSYQTLLLCVASGGAAITHTTALDGSLDGSWGLCEMAKESLICHAQGNHIPVVHPTACSHCSENLKVDTIIYIT